MKLFCQDGNEYFDALDWRGKLAVTFDLEIFSRWERFVQNAEMAAARLVPDRVARWIIIQATCRVPGWQHRHPDTFTAMELLRALERS